MIQIDYKKLQLNKFFYNRKIIKWKINKLILK